MCGIAAICGQPDAETGMRMLRRLAHRGPDDEASLTVADNWLGHRRLSIVDVDGGAQPLANADDDLWLAGNGEIYNHQALRKRLGDSYFRTASDNEVPLRLIEAEGPDALASLNGMFAFAIAGSDNTFVAARDPVGIKPLYWARRGDEVRFASEVRAFDTDWRSFVESFPPGHYWTPERGLVQFSRPVRPTTKHWEEPQKPGQTPPPYLLERIREVLCNSVQQQMMGDVPVGVFLSGGLDSSLIAAIAAEYANRNGTRLKTFAVGLGDSPDLEAARAVSDYLGTEHHERVYTSEDALAVLPEVVRVIESFDPSLVRSAVPNYLLADLTAQNVKVVLTGEGADELFAGYEYLQSFSGQQSLQSELIRTIEGLHNLNLQRCDRVTMAHGLEARVPFLDLDVIELGLALPAAWKIADSDQPEKRLLREAFSGWLPDEFLWRKKAQFGDGSGASSVLKHTARDSVSENEFRTERGAANPPLRTREEAAYYRIFRKHFDGIMPKRILGRFATT
jgi:asparagine synthase (glutamine-hydrolysing)